MKVLTITHGTRGDVQPFVALSVALAQAGHEVVVGAPAGTAPPCVSAGVRFAAFENNWKSWMTEGEARAAIEKTRKGVRRARAFSRLVRQYREMMRSVRSDVARFQTCDADVVVHNVTTPGRDLAEALGVPSVPVCMQPAWIPTNAFRNPLLPASVPLVPNRVSYLWSPFYARMLAGSARRWRIDALGLPPRQSAGRFVPESSVERALVLQAFSSCLLPVDPGSPSWVETTGFWFLSGDRPWRPPAALSRFLDAGEPPVYVGFGSMIGTHPEATGQLVSEAADLAGTRVVVATGWGGISLSSASASTDNVFFLEQAPHDWLFPRMSAVVHHGGSGTTGSALASGRPQVVCPFFGDQVFHARRMYELGTAPAPQPQRSLTARGLATAMRQAAGDPRMARRAAELGELVRSEGGVQAAVCALESLLDPQDGRSACGVREGSRVRGVSSSRRIPCWSQLTDRPT